MEASFSLLSLRMYSADNDGTRKVACFTACGYTWKSGGGLQGIDFATLFSLLNDDFERRPVLEDRCLNGAAGPSISGSALMTRDVDTCPPVFEIPAVSVTPLCVGSPDSHCVSKFPR